MPNGNPLTNFLTANPDAASSLLGMLGMGGGQQAMLPGLSQPTVQVAGTGMFTNIIQMLLNQQMSKFATVNPNVATLQQVANYNQQKEFGYLNRGIYNAATDRGMDPGMASLMSNLAMSQIKSGYSAELMETMERFGLYRDASFREGAVRSLPHTLLRARYGRMSPFYQDKLGKFEDEVADVDKLGLSPGSYGSLALTASDYRFRDALASGTEQLAGDKARKDVMYNPEKIIADLKGIRGMTGYNTAQTFELLTNIYDDVINEQIPALEKFGDKLFELSNAMPGGVQKWAQMSQAMRQQLEGIGVYSPAFAADQAYAQVMNSDGILEASRKTGAKNFSAGLSRARANQEMMTNLQSNRGKVLDALFGLTGTTEIGALQKRLEELGYEKDILGNGFLGEGDALSIISGMDGGLISALAQGSGMSRSQVVDALRDDTITNPAAVMRVINSPEGFRDKMRGSGLLSTDAGKALMGVYARDLTGQARREALFDLRNQFTAFGVGGSHERALDTALNTVATEQQGFNETLRDWYRGGGSDYNALKQITGRMGTGMFAMSAMNILSSEPAGGKEELSDDEIKKRQGLLNQVLESDNGAYLKNIHKLLGLNPDDESYLEDIRNPDTVRKLSRLYAFDLSGDLSPDRIKEIREKIKTTLAEEDEAEKEREGQKPLSKMAAEEFKKLLETALPMEKITKFFDDVEKISTTVQGGKVHVSHEHGLKSLW